MKFYKATLIGMDPISLFFLMRWALQPESILQHFPLFQFISQSLANYTQSLQHFDSIQHKLCRHNPKLSNVFRNSRLSLALGTKWQFSLNPELGTEFLSLSIWYLQPEKYVWDIQKIHTNRWLMRNFLQERKEYLFSSVFYVDLYML